MNTQKEGYCIRAEMIRRITEEHYEPGRQDRCYKWVWRKFVHPLYGIGYRAYLNYLKATATERSPTDGRVAEGFATVADL